MSPYPFSEKRQSWWWLLLLFVPGIMRYCAKEGMAASTIHAQMGNVQAATGARQPTRLRLFCTTPTAT